MQNFVEFLRHAQLINFGILKYSLTATSNNETLIYSYDYLRQIRKYYFKKILNLKAKTFTVELDYSMECHLVDEELFAKVAADIGFIVLNNEYNHIFTLRECLIK